MLFSKKISEFSVRDAETSSQPVRILLLKQPQLIKELHQHIDGESVGEHSSIDQVEGEISEEIQETLHQDGQELKRQSRDP